MSNTLFTASCKWKGPEDTEELMYLSGTTQETYDNLLLVDSLDPNYPASTAFYFSATESDIIVPIIDAAITPVISDGIEFTVNNIRITKFPQPFMFDIPTVSNLNKDSLIVKAVLSILTAESLDKSIVSLDSDGITLTVNRIDVSKFSNNTMFETPSADPVKNISSLRSDPNTYIPDRIELSKFVNNTMFETPLSYSLSKGIFKLVDATAIKKEPIQFWN